MLYVTIVMVFLLHINAHLLPLCCATLSLNTLVLSTGVLYYLRMMFLLVLPTHNNLITQLYKVWSVNTLVYQLDYTFHTTRMYILQRSK